MTRFLDHRPSLGEGTSVGGIEVTVTLLGQVYHAKFGLAQSARSLPIFCCKSGELRRCFSLGYVRKGYEDGLTGHRSGYKAQDRQNGQCQPPAGTHLRTAGKWLLGGRKREFICMNMTVEHRVQVGHRPCVNAERELHTMSGRPVSSADHRFGRLRNFAKHYRLWKHPTPSQVSSFWSGEVGNSALRARSTPETRFGFIID